MAAWQDTCPEHWILALLEIGLHVQAVHCWELGIKAVIVLEQAQVTISCTLMHFYLTEALLVIDPLSSSCVLSNVSGFGSKD